ncbi:hypothetical protein FP435_03070 [Lactobacillus sp. PV037]|uniref:hypothetical protein n=1 Tax=unclassified Lactobacillus TaxID=2620435 RepID=UPI002240966E|nr:MULTISPECIES: hypothetical protein [unclassified Lactobacillus]QNQ82393.1 hypothetical protein FP433_04755 [Lactobacillus sp. PV012]QNQ83493.1 hypothetical protein FP435_03070 [Lactobacillus sp. PV037]
MNDIETEVAKYQKLQQQKQNVTTKYEPLIAQEQNKLVKEEKNYQKLVKAHQGSENLPIVIALAVMVIVLVIGSGLF